MNMNNHQKRVLIGGFTAVLVLTALFILMPSGSLFIAAYCFGLLAVIELFGTIYLLAGPSENSYLTNAAFPFVAYSYAVSNLVFSCLIAALAYFDLWTMQTRWFIFIHIVFAAVLIWRLLAMRSGQEIIEAVEQNVRETVCEWKSIGADVDELKSIAPAECRKDIQNVADALRYADPMTCPQLEELDDRIRDSISLLEQFLNERKTDEVPRVCQDICRQIKLRNSRMKLFK